MPRWSDTGDRQLQLEGLEGSPGASKEYILPGSTLMGSKTGERNIMLFFRLLHLL